MRRRIPEIGRYLRNALSLTLEMEELWLETRRRSEAEVRVLEELAWMRAGLRRSMKISELQAAYARAKARVPSIEVPSRLSLLKGSFSVFRASALRQTRLDLVRFWIQMRRHLSQGRIQVLLRADRIALNALREIRLLAGFLIALATGGSYETHKGFDATHRNRARNAQALRREIAPRAVWPVKVVPRAPDAAARTSGTRTGRVRATLSRCASTYTRDPRFALGSVSSIPSGFSP